MDIFEFFDLSKDFTRETVSAGTSLPRVEVKIEQQTKVEKRKVDDTNYGDEYCRAELDKLSQVSVSLVAIGFGLLDNVIRQLLFQ